MRRFYFCAVLSILTTTLCCADETVSSVTISSALAEGDLVSNVGVVETIENLAINSHGDWIVEALTDFANSDQDGVIVLNDTVLLREGIVGNIDAPADSFADFFDGVSINDAGDGGFNIFIDPLPFTQDSGIYLNNTLIIQESDLADAKGLSAETPFIGFFDAKINNDDVIMIMASIDDPEINSSVDRAIILADTVAGSQTVIAKEGEILPGQTAQVEDFATGPHSAAFNNNGDVMYIAELSGNAVSDNAIYLNQTLIAQEGDAFPDDATSFEFLADRALDINDVGDYIFRANLTGDSSDDDVIVVNGEIFKREGDATNDGFSFTGFGSTAGPVRIGNNGNILWYGEWDNPNEDTNSGLFINNFLAVEEGVTEINGLTVESINNGVDAFALSSDGNWAIFEATLAGGINGAFTIEIENVLLGDSNTDGSVNLLDVSLFVQIICCGSYQRESDINCDGVVDLLDVEPFVEILTGI